MSNPTIAETVTGIIQEYSKEHGSVTATDVYKEAQSRGVQASKPYIFTIFYQLHNSGKVTKIHRGKYCWTEEVTPPTKEARAANAPNRTEHHTELDDATISKLATFVTDLELTEATWGQVEVALQYFFAFKVPPTQDRMAS
jgi:Fe2+ or Zn2+ uptake regulation protein